MFRKVIIKFKPTVLLPRDYKTRFMIRYKSLAGGSVVDARAAFDEMIDMIGETMPDDSTPEEDAAFWLEEARRCY